MRWVCLGKKEVSEAVGPLALGTTYIATRHSVGESDSNQHGPLSPTKKPQKEDEESWTAKDIAESAKTLLDNLQEASGAAQAPRSPEESV
jgi:hypothetical protein